MADGQDIEALKANLEIREENQNFKFKWLGDLQSLKLFVENALNLTGDWKNIATNGGHHFKSNGVSINFYSGTKTLLIQGSRHSEFQKKLIEAVFGPTQNTDSIIPVNERSSFNLTNAELHNDSCSIPESVLEDDGDETYRPSFAQANEAIFQEVMINNLRIEINQKIDFLERKISSSNNCNEKLNSLIEENSRLREVIAQLSCRNSHLEDEKRKLKEEKLQLIKAFEILFQEKGSNDKNANKDANTNEPELIADRSTLPGEKPTSSKNNPKNNQKKTKKRKSIITANANTGNTTANTGNTATTSNPNASTSKR